MTPQLSRYLGAAALAPAGVAAVAAGHRRQRAADVHRAMPPGQTGVIYGCSPFCLPGKYLDTSTGRCMPVPPPPPPAPRY